MKDTLNFRYYKPAPTITVILLLGLGIDFLLNTYVIPFLEGCELANLRFPVNSAIILSILILYDKHLWSYPIFRWLLKVPVLMGRYEGNINFSLHGKNLEKKCVVEIFQTASSIKLAFFFNNEDGTEFTQSESEGETIDEEGGYFRIRFFYKNSGSQTKRNLDTHLGGCYLKLLPQNGQNKKTLQGNYFTNRVPVQTKGIIMVTFASNSLKGTM